MRLPPARPIRTARRAGRTDTPVCLRLWLSWRGALLLHALLRYSCPIPLSTRDDLNAEPAGARLREKCPYWFDFGLALASQCAGEPAFVGLGPMVVAAFQGRYRSLLSRAHTAVESAEQLAFVRLLTREERHGA